MISLKLTAKAWNTENFNQIFKDELRSIDHHLLPLQKGLSFSSYVSDDAISPVIISFSQNEQLLTINTNIFYTGIIAGCSCADDPSPQDLQNECCEITFRVNLNNGDTEVELS